MFSNACGASTIVDARIATLLAPRMASISAVVTILYERVVTVFVVVDVSTQIGRLNKDRHHVQYTLAASSLGS
jgi:hypothetical protein